MRYKQFLTLSLLCTSFYAQSSFVNITSNITPASIYIDNNFTGYTPLYGYKIDSNLTKHTLKVDLNGSKIYMPTIVEFESETNTTKTIHVELKKGKGKIHFVGEDGILYIDGNKIQTFTKDNRIVENEAGKDISIEIYNGNKIYKNTISLDINETKEFFYKLYKENTEQNLYTLIDNKLMWQDNPEAKSTKEHYKEAYKYCDKLDLAGFKDWRVPTLDELQSLYNIKDKIYNGIGDMYYWSSNEYNTTKANPWTYGYAFSFEKEEYEKKSKTFTKETYDVSEI